MRRITLWLTATVAVVALAFGYQFGLAGDKGGEHGGDRGAPSAQVQSGSSSQPSTSTQPQSTTTRSDENRAGQTAGHEEKPGENK